jgi:hypothetical protein
MENLHVGAVRETIAIIKTVDGYRCKTQIAASTFTRESRRKKKREAELDWQPLSHDLMLGLTM